MKTEWKMDRTMIAKWTQKETQINLKSILLPTLGNPSSPGPERLLPQATEIRSGPKAPGRAGFEVWGVVLFLFVFVFVWVLFEGRFPA